VRLERKIPGRVRRYAARASKAARMPYLMVEQSLGLTAQPRIAFLCAAPTVPQVVANYTRGLTLFGRSRARLVIFEWRSYPYRAVIVQGFAKVPKTVRAMQRRTDLTVKFDEDFEDIVRSCQVERNDWKWLTPALVDVYREVHQQGFVSTVGVYREGQLVGGLWGISVGRVLGIMSMFHRADNAGSLALAAVVDIVAADGRWSAVDCGVINEHFKMYGAREIPQREFCELVWQTLK
jgi:leucyl/phenylalanyl-tRNA---protein transferase